MFQPIYVQVINVSFHPGQLCQFVFGGVFGAFFSELWLLKLSTVSLKFTIVFLVTTAHPSAKKLLLGFYVYMYIFNTTLYNKVYFTIYFEVVVHQELVEFCIIYKTR